MYEIGREEVKAISKIIKNGKLFRYFENSECSVFEKKYAKYLSVKHTALASSGTASITAALVGLNIGPGDEVLVPAHTYMATAMSVLSVGAIPVIVDIDESLTIDPKALEESCGPQTKAAIVVHMWGTTCNMNAIMKIAKKKNIFIIEDACQGVGGGYEGKKLGTIGHVGAFSFNYYKNMTSGEGGAVVCNDDKIIERARCAIDPCHFYWQGRKNSLKPFAANGSRASEFMGAILNVQLKRLPKMIKKMRLERDKILKSTKHLSNFGIKQTPLNSQKYDCGTFAFFTFNRKKDAQKFASLSIESRLAACAQIDAPITSVYRWDNQVQSEKEYRIVFKTHRLCLAQLEQLIHNNHPYDTPQFICTSWVSGSSHYLQWMIQNIAI